MKANIATVIEKLAEGFSIKRASKNGMIDTYVIRPDVPIFSIDDILADDWEVFGTRTAKEDIEEAIERWGNDKEI